MQSNPLQVCAGAAGAPSIRANEVLGIDIVRHYFIRMQNTCPGGVRGGKGLGKLEESGWMYKPGLGIQP